MDMEKEASKKTREKALKDAEAHLLELYKVQEQRYQAALHRANQETHVRRNAEVSKADALKPAAPTTDEIIAYAEQRLKFITG